MDIVNHNTDESFSEGLEKSSTSLNPSSPEGSSSPLGNGSDFENEAKKDFILDWKSKSNLRIFYESQAKVIQSQIGSIEELRLKLGLSARRFAQLLMVDPSALTRWTKKGDPVPPHIWRALQWYMVVLEKIPGLTPQYFIGRDPAVLAKQNSLERAQIEASLNEKIKLLDEKNIELETKLKALEAATKANRATAVLLGLGCLILAFALFKVLRS